MVRVIYNLGRKVVKKLVDLGILVISNTAVSVEIQRRIKTENLYFFGLKQLQSEYLLRSTKFIIYKTLIRQLRLRR
jgi:hypothetical protein